MSKTSLKTVEKIAAVITDLDETLWSGILAEKQTITLKKDYYAALEKLYKKGVQLFVVSKNDLPDVKTAFVNLGINSSIFTSVIANWDPKYLNIERLIHNTELRPETVLFVDDSNLERSEVRAKIPKIHCIDAIDWQAILDIPYLKNKKEQRATEITERVNRYRTAIMASEQKEKHNGNDIDFYRSLKRELAIGAISADNLDRFTHLLVDTHRINFNPSKFAVYDEALDYLYARLNQGNKLFAISTKENGISLGFTGALVVDIEQTKATLTDGTFSCGIIGRDFEQKSILALIELLKKQGIEELEALVTPTSTNKRVREVFEDLGFTEKNRTENQITFSVKFKNYIPKKTFDWIQILSTPPELDYTGHPAVIKAFESYVKPLIKPNFKVINLGSAQGEVLGYLQKEVREEFYKFLAQNKAEYTKIDLEFYPEEQNLVGNAEDLSQLVKTESQDLVMAVELLEHTEHFWRVINEIIRVCKVGGYIFITVPSFNYAKHEYPIDLWRIGPKTLSSFFPKTHFKLVKLEKEGKKEVPRRTIILVKKMSAFDAYYSQPAGGKVNWETGLTIFQ